MRIVPRGRVAWGPIRPRWIRTSSRLPPPRSPIIPVAFGIPATTPRAEYRASSVPSRTRMRAPQAASISSTRCGPLRASRTAAVAISSVSPTPSDCARRTNRVTVRVASSIASGSRKAPAASPRPSAQNARSLNSGTRAFSSRSKITSRMEFEPMSMIATARACEGCGGGGGVAGDSIRCARLSFSVAACRGRRPAPTGSGDS